MPPIYRQMFRSTVSAPYKLLVAHHERASDPSKGEAGNPRPIRRGFQTQLISSQRGTGVLGTYEGKTPTLVIRVNSTDYFNSLLGNPPPHYSPDEIIAFSNDIEIYDQVTTLKAGEHFGQTIGNGAGAVADLASELAESLNNSSFGIEASVDPNDNTRVLLNTISIEDRLILKIVSYSYLILNGVPPFIVEDLDGNVIFNPAVADDAVGTIVRNTSEIKPISEF